MKKSEFVKTIIKESDVVQYSENEKFEHHFYTTLESVNVVWESSKISDDYITSGTLNIDWSLTLVSNAKGINLQSEIYSVTGTLTARSYDWDKAKAEEKSFPFTGKGFTIKNEIYFDGTGNGSGNFNISDVYIDVDNKIIKIS